MSDKSQYLGMFFDESAEYIQLLNENILALEKNPDNQKEIIDSIFRAIHSLKGMAATMGFSQLTELTHKMENVLDEVRAGTVYVNTDLIDLLFRGLDYISDLVGEIKKEGDEKETAGGRVEDYLQQLDAFLAGKEIKAASGNKGDADRTSSKEEGGGGSREENKLDDESLKLTDKERKELQKNLAAGDSLYNIVVQLNPESEFKDVRGYMVLNKAEEMGKLIRSQPDSSDFEAGKNFGDFASMLLASDLPLQEIKHELEDIIDVVSIEISKLKFDIDSDGSGNGSEQKEVSTGDRKNKDISFSSTVRVDINKLDHLMNMVGELLINKTRLETLDIDLSKYKDILTQLDRVTMELHHIVMQIRMVPVGMMFNRFPRMMRDLSHQMGKDVNFIIKGEDTELDRSIIDELSDPLIHLLRNSIDHGIEDSSVRESQGKDKKGTILLKASQKGSEILIEVKDDGRGIDADKLEKAAIKKGIITAEEAEQMEERDKLNLIFEPGFSTTEEVSDISGRGVGLDVVKQVVEKLDGKVYIESEINAGTRFIISLPLTLAITKALMVKILGETFAIPLNAINETQILKKEAVKQVKGQNVVVLRDKTIPLIDSKKILNLIQDENEDKKREEIPVVIINTGERQIGLIIDELLNQQEIVIKSLSDYFDDIKNISGATIIGDGDVALILDVRNIG